MLSNLLHRFAGTPDEVLRKIQMGGLVRSARLVSNVLGNPPPDADEMPEWIEEILMAATRRICRYDDEAMPDPEDCGSLEATKTFMDGMPPQTQLEFQSLMVLLEVSPYVFGPVAGRFTQLDGKQQDQVLKGWETASLVPKRTGFRAIKSVVMMGYWSRPETWPAIGYSIHDNPGVPSPQKNHWKQREEPADG